MATPLIFNRAELVDRTGSIELVFVDPADGAEWRVAVRSLREPVLPPPPVQGGEDSKPDRPVRRPGEWYAPSAEIKR